MPSRRNTAATVEPDVDVDTSAADTETDTVAEGSESTSTTQKAATKPTRPAVAEGRLSPVQFAALLNKSVDDGGRGQGIIEGTKPVKSQMIYSYMKQYADGPNPFPVKVDDNDRKSVDPAEGLAWWDAKEARKVASAERKTQKEAEAAAKAAQKAATASEAEGSSEAEGEITEAE